MHVMLTNLLSLPSHAWVSEFCKNLDLMCRQGRLEEARRSLAWLREGEHYLEEEDEILEVDAFHTFLFGDINWDPPINIWGDHGEMYIHEISFQH